MSFVRRDACKAESLVVAQRRVRQQLHGNISYGDIVDEVDPFLGDFVRPQSHLERVVPRVRRPVNGQDYAQLLTTMPNELSRPPVKEVS